MNSAWTESTIDASNAPPLGGAIVSGVSITTADKNQYILVDVTSAVQAWLSGSETNNGIALVANSSFNATFDSKENTATSHPAELDIAYAGTITGVTTPSGSGLTGGGTSGTLNLSLTNACASSQVLQWNGTAWACASVERRRHDHRRDGWHRADRRRHQRQRDPKPEHGPGATAGLE